MKKISSIIIALFVTISIISAQDTLYVYKAGVVVTKKAVNDLDSLSFTYTPPVPETIKDIDGNTYHSIKIGTQTWMVENLKTTKFRTGESLSNITDNTAWNAATFAAWCDYNNDAANGVKYGKLYNWYAVNDSRNIAPAGWHVASYDEWTTLKNFVTANLGFSTNTAKALASATDWIVCDISGSVGNDLTKNNSTGFSALPGGYRYVNSGFSFLGSWGFWWSSLSGGEQAQSIHIVYYNTGLYFEGNSMSCGMSVRCVKD